MGEHDEGLAARRTALRRTNRLALLRQSDAASVAVLCECGRSCRKWLHLEADEYEGASARGRNVLAPGHQDAATDRVVRERRSYIVVEGPRVAVAAGWR
jgi:hypothetical protein